MTVLLTSIIAGAVASNSTESYSSVLSDAIVLAIAAAFSLLGGSCRIVGTPDGIQVVNFLFRLELAATNIAKIQSSRGLVFLTADGQSVSCFAYGESLIGGLFGYRRAGLAEKRCEAWVQARLLDNVPSSTMHTRRLRPAVIWVPMVLIAVYLTEAFIIHKLTS